MTSKDNENKNKTQKTKKQKRKRKKRKEKRKGTKKKRKEQSENEVKEQTEICDKISDKKKERKICAVMTSNESSVDNSPIAKHFYTHSVQTQLFQIKKDRK